MKNKHILFLFALFPFITAAQEIAPKRFSLIAEGALGINTNPTLENINTSQPQQTGRGKGQGQNQNALLSQSDLETQFSTKAHYKAVKTDTFTLHTNYEFWGEFFAKNSEESLMTHNISLPMNSYTENYHFELVPMSIYQTQNNTPYLSNTGVEGRATSRFESFDLTLFSSFFQVNALDNNYSYMNGEIIALGAEITIPLEHSEFSLSGTSLQSNNKDEIGNIASYTGFSLIPYYSYSSEEWNHSLSFGYEQKDYKKEINNNVERKDKLIFARYKPSYFISKDFALFIDLKYTSNDSNIETNKYDQFLSLVGFTWIAF